MIADNREYFEFVEDSTLADIAIRCRARTLEQIFILNTKAILEICLENPSKLRKEENYTITVQNNQLDLLLVKFLNEIIFIKDAKGLLLCPAKLHIKQEHENIICESELKGDYIHNGYEINIDPKAVTFHKLKCEKINDEWESFVIIDV